ncbi:hypothetical protein [Mobilicoccus pelagius]|uniref:DUF4149 domain-containing protein n=1 Tax=Mobilicoccus pelagius NBRC 104925 TaxID=1089455 RepID=H5UPS6_9MICO|nr:hypothetical protein [Mobilicoccus pelagius]GAB47731.1 hypothetical protein MOPEL_029_00100 [Mobilicoccus pelagius NBRC 104925]
MSVLSTTVRATHLLTNAAWFGGSLMGAVGLNPATREPDTARERREAADTGWNRWGPVQGAAIGLHLLSGLGIVADNRRRVFAHPPTTAAVVLKTATTGAAIASSLAAWKVGETIGDTGASADDRAQARRHISWLQWATPVTTGALLVLDAYLGEQQRGVAGLLDRPMGRR